MKNLQSYEYEKSMLDCLNETFQKALKEYECLEKYEKGSDAYERQGEIADRRMDEAIAQKELVESVIGECVNLQKDGVIRIGVDNVVNYTDYLNTLHTECYIGSVYAKTILHDDDKPTGGTSYNGETLADFIDEDGDSNKFRGENGRYDLEKINQALYDCGIVPLKYDGGGMLYPINDKEQTAKYAINRAYLDGKKMNTINKADVNPNTNTKGQDNALIP